MIMLILNYFSEVKPSQKVSRGDIVRPRQKMSTGDNVDNKLKKRLQWLFLVRKKFSTIAKWATLLKLVSGPWVLLFSPHGMKIRAKFTPDSSDFHYTSPALLIFILSLPIWQVVNCLVLNCTKHILYFYIISLFVRNTQFQWGCYKEP